MKDSVRLFITAIAVSVCAWALWHFLKDDAFAAIALIALVGVVADNRRLRRALRDSNNKSKAQ